MCLFTFSRYIFLSRCSEHRLSVTLLILSRFQTWWAQPYCWGWAITTNHKSQARPQPKMPQHYIELWQQLTLLQKIQKISILIMILQWLWFYMHFSKAFFSVHVHYIFVLDRIFGCPWHQRFRNKCRWWSYHVLCHFYAWTRWRDKETQYLSYFWRLVFATR